LSAVWSNIPFDRGAKAPYSAAVFIDGSQVIAEDANGSLITSGTAGTDDKTVIEAAVDACTVSSIGNGTIFLKKPLTNALYTISALIDCPAGILIDSDGAGIDAHLCNAPVFSFGDAGTNREAGNHLSGLRGLYFKGPFHPDYSDVTKTDNWVAVAYNVGRDLLFENIKCEGMWHGLDIQGSCYVPKIEHVKAIWMKGGYMVRGYGLNTNYEGPNGLVIHNCENGSVSGSPYHSLNPVIDLSYQAGYNWQVTRISDCWLEDGAPGIRVNGGSPVEVVNCTINSKVADDHMIELLYGDLFVTNTYFTGPGSGTGMAIYVNNVDSRLTLTGGKFYANGIGTGANGGRITALGPGFVSISGIDAISGKWYYSTFKGATFSQCSQCFNLTPLAGYATPVMGCNFRNTAAFVPVAGSPTDINFVGNTVVGNTTTLTFGTRCILANNNFSHAAAITMGNYSRMHDNEFQATPTITPGTSTIIHDNYGYATENSGSSTGTGSEQTIAHGLSVTTGVRCWIKYPISATRFMEREVDFDTTNIFPTVNTGIAYEWRIE
jgi:hypothetical protein